MTTSAVTGRGTHRRLWRPGSNSARVEHRALVQFAVRSAVSPVTILCLLVGPAAIASGTGGGRTWFGWVQLLLGVVLVVAGLLYSSTDYLRTVNSVDDTVRRRVLHDRSHGVDFYSIGDFAGLPTNLIAAVATIMDSLRTLHESAAVAWLDASLLREAHQAAWDIVSIVYQTREIRLGVRQAGDQADLAELVRAVDGKVAAIDAGVTTVAESLQQAVVLAQEWTATVDAMATATRLRAELETATASPIAPVVRAAESVSEGVFAYVTAARDVTGAGPFSWERSSLGRRGDDGAMSVLAAVLIPALLFVLALLVDGSGKMRAITRADALAAEAARAAETALDTRGTTIIVDSATAATAAQNYLRNTGNPGEVTIENTRTVRVSVTVEQPATLGLLVDSYRATGTATAVLGVGTRSAGAFP